MKITKELVAHVLMKACANKSDQELQQFMELYHKYISNFETVEEWEKWFNKKVYEGCMFEHAENEERKLLNYAKEFFNK
jgi:hypothetical protein